MEGGDDEGGASGGGGGGHMDSDSSDSEVVGPPLPPGYEVLDVFGTDVLVLQLLLSQRDHFQNHVPHLQCSVGL